MTPAELVSSLAGLGIRLWVEEGRLRYQAPKGALTPELRQRLAEEKAALIAYLQGGPAPGEVSAPGEHPLSHNQQFLWFLYQLAPQSSAYNVAFVARIVARVDFERLRSAFRTLVDRHPMLRTTYGSRDGVPSMRIHDSIDFECGRIDASGWSEETLERSVREKYDRPFDLARGPVLRVHLFSAGEEDHVLLVTIHHIACDGWSIGILMREFRDLYAGVPEADLEPLGAPYTDFTRYQRELVRGPEGAAHLDFWRRRLAAPLPDINLPTDKPRPKVRVPRGACHHFRVGGELYKKLASLAKSSGATLYTLLLAAFQVLLARYGSQEDVLIGTPMAGRPRREDESTVGCYVNPVVLRGAVAPESPFKDLLAATRKVFTEALEHRDYPFPRIVEEISPARDPGRTPVFEVMFNLLSRRTLGPVADLLYRDKAEASKGEPVDFGALKMRPFPMDQEEGQFDLVLEMIDNGRSLTGLFKYSTDLYESATVARMAGHYEEILRGVAADPGRRVDEIRILPESERRELIETWNRTDVDYPKDLCLHHLFEAQARRTPDAVAVTFEGASLTYAELDRRADRLARRLRSMGVGPDATVGVHCERSLEMVVALYAILKAGGAYVPLDPDYPQDRLDFMVGEIKAPVILSQRNVREGLGGISTPVLCLDGPGNPWEAGDAFSGVALDGGARPDNLAYIIYTSGSTGTPKGVMNTHRGIVNRILWMQEAFGLTPGDVVLQKTPFSFDVSVWEFFWPLAVGAKLVVAGPGGHRDSAYLARTIIEHGVTTVHFVPSMLQLFLEDKGAPGCRSLKRVISSGEALTTDLQEKFFALIDAELHNLYGPTEAAVDVTWWPCRRGDGRRVVPIGRPIANTQVYVLDRRLEPVPAGVAGELYIGGVQVARGYINRPDLTAERFLPDPFRKAPGATLYKTGDLCRRLADGAIEYLGRNDFQVKVRGMRVELGEIEAAMRAFPGVVDAVVALREDVPGDKRLAGYVVPAANTEVREDDLRAFLKRRLAEYMVPASLTALEVFPRTASGKVDRRALPAPERERRSERAFAAPRGETERAVARIWQELLGVNTVGLEDNFFDLGGHSLLVVRMAARLQDAFHRDVRVVDLFEHPTVREQAGLVGGEEPEGRRGQAASPRISGTTAAPTGVPGAMEGIAVIGMACRFPGAPNVERFWENLRGGVESIRRFTDAELEALGVPPEVIKSPNYVKAAPLLDDIDKFDAAFFGYAPKEAEVIDPQQRLFLECAWTALEDAGCDPGSYPGSIGVFGGVSPNYYGAGTAAALDEADVVANYQRELGNEKDYLATRVSYKLDLTGPSLTVQTACSTSLVAAHVACQNLWTRQCDLALAGGVSVNTRLRGGYFYQEGMIPSPDGHCRPFDAKARGTVVGQGVGVVVLKRLSDAMADGDTVHAVIRGSAVNNDGSAKVGFTAPGVEGQAAVISRALSIAGVAPEEIGYVEAHGTGTPLGDPIEIKALTKAFGLPADRRATCAVGSVKSNFGHLDAAAGVAGLIKTVLALEHREIPASLHFETANPELDLDNTPFFVNARLREWPKGSTPRRAGVSSFGLGGTNAHMVLEEAPPAGDRPRGRRSRHLLTLSAKTAAALDAETSALASYLAKNPGLDAADAAFTLQTGRKALEHRRTLVCADVREASEVLASADAKRVITAVCEKSHRDVAFMFSGQGSQYVNMGLDLYNEEPVFREEIDRAAEILGPELGLDLRDLLYPPAERAAGAEERLTQTAVTQPALFAVELALAKLWMSWGIHPQALIGHSVGEYTAACLADVFAPEDAYALVAARGRLMQSMPPGSMLAVSLTEKDLAPLLPADLDLAVINGPSMSVVSGETAAVERFETVLAEMKVTARRVLTSHAFHSRMMEPALAPFTELLIKARPKPPRIPFLSNVTGTWITAEQAADPAYWATHLRRTVRFSDGLAELFKEPGRVCLEAGPGRVLAMLAAQQADRAKRHVVVASTRHPRESQSDVAFILEALGALWRAGVPIDWAAFHAGETRRKLPLPTRVFEPKRFWVEAAPLGPRTRGGKAAPEAKPAGPEIQGKGPERGTDGATARPGAPRTPTEKTLARFWQENLGVDSVDLDADFFDLGGHSLVALAVLAKVEKEFGVRLPLASLISAPTVRQFAALLGEPASRPGWSSLVPLNASGSKPPLFLMHSHGGNVLEYQPLAHRLDKERPLYALQARGLDGSTIPEPEVEEMAARYLEEIRTVQPHGPYRLGGFCFGGFLALEAAQQLRAAGEEVALLVMINASTTDYPRYSRTTHRLRHLHALVYRILLELNDLQGLSLRKTGVHLVDRGRRARDLIRARFEELLSPWSGNDGGKPGKRHSTVFYLERLARAHDRAWAGYVPKPYEGRVLFFAARRQPLAILPDPLLGWGGMFTNGVEAHVVPGFRQTLLDEPNVLRLAEILSEALDEVDDIPGTKRRHRPLPLQTGPRPVKYAR